jgi:peptidyl-prolyl cis-trans isomerase SurA
MRWFVLMLLLPLMLGAAPARAPVIELDRIVAVVNDEIITESELAGRVAETEQQLAAQRIEAPPRDVLRRQLLERMIVEELQLQLAARTGIRVTDADVERAIASIAERNDMSVPELYRTVRAQGFERESYRDQVRRQLTIQQLIDREINSRITVSESEVNSFLERAGADARRNDEYNLSHIYIPVAEDAAAERLRAARAQAEDIRAQLLAGADFARLAVSYSQGPDALKGGALGWRGAGQLPELFLEAIRGLEPGEISPVLRGPNGFHILRLNDRRGGAAAQETVEETHVRHILLRPNELRSLEEARMRLLEIRERLAAGEDFAELARTYSEDPVSAADGGDLGWVAPGQLVPEFARAMSRLAPGAISEPVETPFGLHLIQVLDRRERTVTGERERAAARQQIHARKADDRYEQWVRQLRDEAYVELMLGDFE